MVVGEVDGSVDEAVVDVDDDVLVHDLEAVDDLRGEEFGADEFLFLFQELYALFVEGVAADEDFVYGFPGPDVHGFEEGVG